MNTSEAPTIQQNLKTDQEISPELRDIADRIFGATNLNEILIDLKDDLMSLFNAERLTVYVVDGVKKELVSLFMSAGEVDEIRVPISGHRRRVTPQLRRAARTSTRNKGAVLHV